MLGTQPDECVYLPEKASDPAKALAFLGLRKAAHGKPGSPEPAQLQSFPSGGNGWVWVKKGAGSRCTEVLEPRKEPGKFVGIRADGIVDVALGLAGALVEPEVAFVTAPKPEFTEATQALALLAQTRVCAAAIGAAAVACRRNVRAQLEMRYAGVLPSAGAGAALLSSGEEEERRRSRKMTTATTTATVRGRRRWRRWRGCRARSSSPR